MSSMKKDFINNLKYHDLYDIYKEILPSLKRRCIFQTKYFETPYKIKIYISKLYGAYTFQIEFAGKDYHLVETICNYSYLARLYKNDDMTVISYEEAKALRNELKLLQSDELTFMPR